jgi:RNA polymerase sigma-70 factor (ECF subfamily)
MSPDRQVRWSEWMVAAQSGDGPAYEALLREILPHVREFIRASISDEASAEHVAKIVLLSIHRARHSYRREQPFEPWLFAIVRKSVADFLRSRGRHPGPENPRREGSSQGQVDPVSTEQIDKRDPKKRTPLPDEGKVLWS